MQERFNKQFVDELNIGKYDYEEVIEFIEREIERIKKKYEKKIEKLNDEIYDLNESIDLHHE